MSTTRPVKDDELVLISTPKRSVDAAAVANDGYQYPSPPAIRNMLVDAMSTESKPPKQDAPLCDTLESYVCDDKDTPSSPAQRDPSSDDRRRREEEESLELARALMAEEAMLSYQQHFESVRTDHLSAEDLEAYQAVMAEDERQEQEEVAAELDDGNLSYDAMLQLGERIGDVKSERWALQAQRHIDQLPIMSFGKDKQDDDAGSGGGTTTGTSNDDDSAWKCLVCQCEYQTGESLRRLPCGHAFHKDCIDPWLQSSDRCAYCRQSIVVQNDDDADRQQDE